MFLALTCTSFHRKYHKKYPLRYLEDEISKCIGGNGFFEVFRWFFAEARWRGYRLEQRLPLLTAWRRDRSVGIYRYEALTILAALAAGHVDFISMFDICEIRGVSCFNIVVAEVQWGLNAAIRKDIFGQHLGQSGSEDLIELVSLKGYRIGSDEALMIMKGAIAGGHLAICRKYWRQYKRDIRDSPEAILRSAIDMLRDAFKPNRLDIFEWLLEEEDISYISEEGHRTFLSPFTLFWADKTHWHRNFDIKASYLILMKYLEDKGGDISGWIPLQTAAQIGIGDAVD